MSFRFVGVVVAALIIFSGCASNRSKRWATASAGVSVGAALGGATAPSGERRELHSAYWGALVGLLSYFVSDLVFSDQNEIDTLRMQLDLHQNANTVLLKEGKGSFKQASGDEAQASAGQATVSANKAPVSGGKAKWRLYQVDRWVKEGNNKLFHQDRMVEISPLEGDTPVGAETKP